MVNMSLRPAYGVVFTIPDSLRFLRVFSFAKVGSHGAVPSTAPKVAIPGKNLAAAFSDYYIIWVFREIFTEIPWRKAPLKDFLWISKEKNSTEMKSMTTKNRRHTADLRKR